MTKESEMKQPVYQPKFILTYGKCCKEREIKLDYFSKKRSSNPDLALDIDSMQKMFIGDTFEPITESGTITRVG